MIPKLILAMLAGLAIFSVGFWFLRAVSADSGPDPDATPDDVADLDVFFVCRECGTEYQVTKVGQLTVPRHCGEPMEIQRRPKGP
jgi:hypothetical protein